MHLFTTLLLAHLFADFPLQTNALAKFKKASLMGVFLHVLVYIATTTWAIRDPWRYWPLILGLGIAHFLIDALKKYCPPTLETFYFLIDQGLHFFTIGVATLLALRWWTNPPQSNLPADVVLIALVCALILGSMVFCWVWVNSLSEEHVQQHPLLRWTKQQMLVLEQRIGLVLLGFVFAIPTYQWLTTVLHLGNR